MYKFIITSLLFVVCQYSLISQWQQLTTNTNTSIFAVKFFNANTGLIAGQDTVGKIFRTTNGGVNWSLVYRTDYSESFRCIFFINESTGWIGSYNRIIYKTTNGGVNWAGVSNSIGTGGINDICFINENTGWLITGTGGAGTTSDGGLSWFMNAPNFSGRAVHFFNGLTGIIATNERTIRRSISAGNGYTQIYQLPAYAFVTDFHFLNSQTGFAAGNDKLIVKTTNSGLNWDIINLDNNGPPAENFRKIFFIDEQLGYGAGQNVYPGESVVSALFKKTTNGGLNWTDIFLNSNTSSFEDIIITEGQTAYIVGMQNHIFRSTNAGYIGINPISSEIPSHFSLYQNYPNPFNPSTKIKFEIPLNVETTRWVVSLRIFDILGREVHTLVNENLKPGIYEADFNAADLPSGVYFYKLQAGEFKDTKKMILIK